MRSPTRWHYEKGDRVTTSFTGPTVWDVVFEMGDASGALKLSLPNGAILYANPNYVSPVRMSEPTELGAVVMTDKGRAVRYTEGDKFRWYMADSAAGAKSWGELQNPRPVGDK
jgi:hypothetical protein